MNCQKTTAEELIDTSILENRTTSAARTDELEIDLAVECEDYVMTVFGLEYWGGEGAREWRVSLVDPHGERALTD